MRRVLHIARPGAAVPAAALGPGDVVVYTGRAPAHAPPVEHYVWHHVWHHDRDAAAGSTDHDHDQARPPALDAAGVCALAFRVDTVIVW